MAMVERDIVPDDYVYCYFHLSCLPLVCFKLSAKRTSFNLSVEEIERNMITIS